MRPLFLFGFGCFLDGGVLALHEGFELLAGHVFVLQQELGHGVQLVPVLGQQLQGLAVGGVDDGFDLVVDLSGHALGVALGFAIAAADEDLILRVV